MLFVLSFCHKDAELALKNAQWIVTLKNQRQHKVLLACNPLSDELGWLEKIQDVFLSSGWEVVTFASIEADERQMFPNQRGWPREQNAMWRSAAAYVQRVFNEPWLWLEADAMPLCDRWLDLLELEYQANKQPFMGMYVATLAHDGKPIPEHMSGVAIYPANIGIWSSKMAQSDEIAFDMQGAEVTVHNMHRTQLIHHCYQSPPFMSVEDLDRINPQAVIFHQNKDGSLIDRLEEKRGWKLNPAWVEAGPESDVVFNFHPDCVKDPGVICDIYIKTWSRDFPWLEYCLKSIARYAKGFRQIIVESETLPSSGFIPVQFKWVESKDRQPGYLWQQRCKLYADQHTDADYILYMDSDTIFTRDVTPEYFMRGGKPVWLYTMFDKARKDQQVWKPVMHKFVGIEPDREMMRRHPFMAPRKALTILRDFCRQYHNQSLEDYIMAQHQEGKMLTFSEWNCMGWWAHSTSWDLFTFMDAENPGAPECAVWQGFTHGGEDRKKADLEQMETLLNPSFAEARTRVSAYTIEERARLEPSPQIRATKNGAYDGPAPQTREVTISEQIRGHVTCIKALIEPSKVGRTQILHAELRKAGLLGPAPKRSPRKVSKK